MTRLLHGLQAQARDWRARHQATRDGTLHVPPRPLGGAAAPDDLPVPTPDQLRADRAAAGLTQAQAAALAGYGARERWAELEAGMHKQISPWRYRYWRHVAGIEAIPFGIYS